MKGFTAVAAENPSFQQIIDIVDIPDLSKAPKDLLQLFCEAMLEAIELLNEECELGAAT